jgi:hypothetical protein
MRKRRETYIYGVAAGDTVYEVWRDFRLENERLVLWDDIHDFLTGAYHSANRLHRETHNLSGRWGTDQSLVELLRKRVKPLGETANITTNVGELGVDTLAELAFLIQGPLTEVEDGLPSRGQPAMEIGDRHGVFRQRSL